MRNDLNENEFTEMLHEMFKIYHTLLYTPMRTSENYEGGSCWEDNVKGSAS